MRAGQAGGGVESRHVKTHLDHALNGVERIMIYQSISIQMRFVRFPGISWHNDTGLLERIFPEQYPIYPYLTVLPIAKELGGRLNPKYKHPKHP